METLDVKLPWKPQGKDFMATLYRIQWQKANVIHDFQYFRKVRKITMAKRQYLELQITTKFVNFYQPFKVFNVSTKPEAHDLVEYTSRRKTK